MQKYSVNQHLIETLLTWVKSGEIAIPEKQQLLVRKSFRVRLVSNEMVKRCWLEQSEQAK